MRTVVIDKDEYIKLLDTKYLIGLSSKRRVNSFPTIYVDESDSCVRITIHSSVVKHIIQRINFRCGLVELIFEKKEGAAKSINGNEAYRYFYTNLKKRGFDINTLKREYEIDVSEIAITALGTNYEKGTKLIDEGGIFIIDINSAYTAGHVEINDTIREVLTDVYNKKKLAKSPEDRQYYKDILNKLNGYFKKVKGLSWMYDAGINKAKQLIIEACKKIQDKGGVILRIATDSITFQDKAKFFRNNDFNELLNIGDELGQYKLEGIWDRFEGESPNNIQMNRIKNNKPEVLRKHSGVKNATTIGKTIDVVKIRESIFDLYEAKARKHYIVGYKIKEEFRYGKKDKSNEGNVRRDDSQTEDQVPKQICGKGTQETPNVPTIEGLQEPTSNGQGKKENKRPKKIYHHQGIGNKPKGRKIYQDQGND